MPAPAPKGSTSPIGGYRSGPSILRQLFLCPLSLCQTFRQGSDITGCWGECEKCGKRVGFVSREALRAYANAEERDRLVHLAHCNQGDWEGSCKYGDDEKCAALKHVR